jgi:hypothetical protein
MKNLAQPRCTHSRFGMNKIILGICTNDSNESVLYKKALYRPDPGKAQVLSNESCFAAWRHPTAILFGHRPGNFYIWVNEFSRRCISAHSLRCEEMSSECENRPTSSAQTSKTVFPQHGARAHLRRAMPHRLETHRLCAWKVYRIFVSVIAGIPDSLMAQATHVFNFIYGRRRRLVLIEGPKYSI